MNNKIKKIVGYSDVLSVRPNYKISFMISCDSKIKYIYSEFVKLIQGDCNPEGPGFKEEKILDYKIKRHKAINQKIYSGSFIYLPIRKKILLKKEITFITYIFPTLNSKKKQTIFSSDYENKNKIKLFINKNFCLELSIGNKKILSLKKKFFEKNWYLIGFSNSPKSKKIKLFQLPVNHENTLPEIITRDNIKNLIRLDNHLSIGSSIKNKLNKKLVNSNSYNGKIDNPKIYEGLISENQLLEKTMNLKLNFKLKILLNLDFSKHISNDKIIDKGKFKLSGYTVNFPARAMKGILWNGGEFNWKLKPQHYSAIHFHDDDIYDAKWNKTFDWIIPKNFKSGIYSARVFDKKNNEDYIPFTILPSKKITKNKILFLLPTASYMAYANDHNSVNAYNYEMLMGRLTVLQQEDIFLDKHREYGLSTYDTHSDGSGVCYTSRLRPILNMRPKYSSSNGGIGSGLWQFNADTHIVDWLERHNFKYDVITDEDLEKEGLKIIKDYKVIITSSHPEYQSTKCWDAIYSFQNNGGNLMYLGGNGWYWRIVWHDKFPGIIEVRRAEGGVRAWEAEAGEYYHSFNGEYGGLWRRLGRAPNKLLGVGFTGQGFDVSSYYRRKPQSYLKAVDFIFKNVDDEIIGDFGLIGGGAAGLEIDRYDQNLGSPKNCYVLATSENHSDLYLGVTEEIGVNLPNQSGSQNPKVKADLIYFKKKSGSKNFSTGSIAWSGSLSHNDYNNNISRITYNVLKNFSK